MAFVSEKTKPVELVEVEGVGAFNKKELQGKSKEEIAKHFSEDNGFTKEEADQHVNSLYDLLGAQQEQKEDAATYMLSSHEE